MKLKIWTKDFKQVEVRSRKVLQKTFPQLELYVHRTLADEDNTIPSYTVSTLTGICICGRHNASAGNIIAYTKDFINAIGVQKILEREKEILIKISKECDE